MGKIKRNMSTPEAVAFWEERLENDYVITKVNEDGTAKVQIGGDMEKRKVQVGDVWRYMLGPESEVTRLGYSEHYPGQLKAWRADGLCIMDLGADGTVKRPEGHTLVRPAPAPASSEVKVGQRWRHRDDGRRVVVDRVRPIGEGRAYAHLQDGAFGDVGGIALESLENPVPIPMATRVWVLDEPELAGRHEPRCGQRWRGPRTGLIGTIYDHRTEGAVELFKVRLEDGERGEVAGEYFECCEFIDGPVEPETPREAYERVVRLEAADVPEGLNADRWLGMLLNRCAQTTGCNETAAARPRNHTAVRDAASALRTEHAARWQAWRVDASKGVIQ